MPKLVLIVYALQAVKGGYTTLPTITFPYTVGTNLCDIHVLTQVAEVLRLPARDITLVRYYVDITK